MSIIEQQLIQLETKIAYQEDTIQTLNEVMSQQQQQINRLENTLKVLLRRVQANSGSVEGINQNELPPHY